MQKDCADSQFFTGRRARLGNGSANGIVENPLAGIKGAALIQSDLSPENLEFAKMIVEETDRVTALLDRMEGFTGGGGALHRQYP